jgi:hypothetical protein
VNINALDRDKREKERRHHSKRVEQLKRKEGRKEGGKEEAIGLASIDNKLSLNR